MEITSTISLVEVIYTVASVFGLAVTGAHLRLIAGDLTWLERLRLNGGRQIVAKEAYRRMLTNCIVLAGFCIIGVMAMSLPPRPRELHEEITLGDIAPVASALIFFVVAVLISIDAARSRLSRERLIRYYMETAPDTPPPAEVH